MLEYADNAKHEKYEKTYADAETGVLVMQVFVRHGTEFSVDFSPNLILY